MYVLTDKLKSMYNASNSPSFKLQGCFNGTPLGNPMILSVFKRLYGTFAQGCLIAKAKIINQYNNYVYVHVC